jgi:hypothetical protein
MAVDMAAAICAPPERSSQQLHPIGPSVVDLDDCVGIVELCQRLAVAPVRSPGVSGNDLPDLVLGAHDILRFSLWFLSVSGLWSRWCRTLSSRPSRAAAEARLGRPADQITLGEIYRSSIGDKPLWAPRTDGPRECLVTDHSAEYFARLTDETEAAVIGALTGRTLADSLDELRVIGRVNGASASEIPD